MIKKIILTIMLFTLTLLKAETRYEYRTIEINGVMENCYVLVTSDDDDEIIHIIEIIRER